MLQQGVSLREADEIRTPPIRTAISCAAALHELGHMLAAISVAGESSSANAGRGPARANCAALDAAMERSAVEGTCWGRARAADIDRRQAAENLNQPSA